MRRRANSLVPVSLFALFTLALPGCPHKVTDRPDLAVSPDLSTAPAHDLSAIDAAVDAAIDAMSIDAADAGCTPTVTSCTGLCGPVSDKCLNMTFQCGGCGPGMVCDLQKTHMCVMPQTDCTALGVQCGPTKDSCGNRIECGTCPDGMECNADTNKCVTCQQVTCIDLGFECGMAWLGCGPTTNLTDCGNCPSNKVCNNAYNVCEPKCASAPDPVAVCAAAKQRQLDCGFISDGCGGLVDCGNCTQPGYGCGVGGDANRCSPFETPLECKAAGRQCDPPGKPLLDSACGGKLHCGVCPTGQVCNDNYICGAPCKPKKCADYPNQCLSSIDDGCGGKITNCNNCVAPAVCLPAPAPNVAQACCTTLKTCAKDYPGVCGTHLDNGCGGFIDCTCATGACPTPAPAMGSTAACCMTKRNCSFYGTNVCGKGLSDGCGGTIDCNTCDGTHVCPNPEPTGSTVACCSKATCAVDGCKPQTDCSGATVTCNCGRAGSGGNLCSTDQNSCCNNACGAQCGINVTDCTGTHACNCPNGSNCLGTCCDNVACPANQCTGSVKHCDNSTTNCTATCTLPQTCGGGGNPLLCGCTPKKCSDFPGQCGTQIPDGCGNFLNCGCAGTAKCLPAPPPGTLQACCTTFVACPANSCGTMIPDGCNGFHNCSCSANNVCPVPPPATGTTAACCPKAKCAADGCMPAGPDCSGATVNCSCGRAGSNGSICSSNQSSCCNPASCGNSCGTSVKDCAGTVTQCNCTPPKTCGAITAGQCGCVKKTCADYPGQCGATFSDGCGGNINGGCGCGGTQVCNPQTSMCCQPDTCAGNHPNGCGVYSNSCGGTLDCSGVCVAPQTCGGGVMGPGFCGCTPIPKNVACLGQAGIVKDGCGGNWNCSS